MGTALDDRWGGGRNASAFRLPSLSPQVGKGRDALMLADLAEAAISAATSTSARAVIAGPSTRSSAKPSPTLDSGSSREFAARLATTLLISRSPRSTPFSGHGRHSRQRDQPGSRTQAGIHGPHRAPPHLINSGPVAVDEFDVSAGATAGRSRSRSGGGPGVAWRRRRRGHPGSGSDTTRPRRSPGRR